MRKLFMLVLIAVVLMGANLTQADPTSSLQRAEINYRGGRPIDAITEIREAMLELYNESPLVLNNVTWISSPPTGYGQYDPKISGVFDPAQPLLLYMEPVGYTIKKSGSFYSFGFKADLKVTAVEGGYEGGLRNFAEEHVDSRSLTTEYSIFYTFNFKELPPGEYNLEVTVHDENSNKKAVAKVTFRKR